MKVDSELLMRIRGCMKRWSARYAGSDHAKKHVIETALLIQEIDELIVSESSLDTGAQSHLQVRRS